MADDANQFDFGDNVDTSTFEQILEMDDEDDSTHEFSQSIVFGFFEQATSTFKQMDEALKDKDLPQLSRLGHYLKGSSATIGFSKVKDQCEKIQNFGAYKDETGTKDEDDKAKLLSQISVSLTVAKTATNTCEILMKEYYAALEAA